MTSTKIIGIIGCGLFISAAFTDDMTTLVTGATLIISSQLWMIIEK